MCFTILANNNLIIEQDLLGIPCVKEDQLMCFTILTNTDLKIVKD